MNIREEVKQEWIKTGAFRKVDANGKGITLQEYAKKREEEMVNSWFTNLPASLRKQAI